MQLVRIKSRIDLGGRAPMFAHLEYVVMGAKSKPSGSMTQSGLHKLAMIVKFLEKLLVRIADLVHAANSS